MSAIVYKWGVGFQTGLLIPFRCDGILRKKATMKKNYYLVLGVASKAGAKDIEAAFRRRARELHPDTAGLQSGPFLEVQEAYSVLADPERRRHYDRVIHPPPAAQRRPRPKAEPLRPSKAAGSFREVSIGESFASYRPSFDELFDRWWGNFQSVGRPKAETIESLTVEVVIQPEEARWGGRVRVNIPAQATCPACGGRGAVGPYQCWRCQGHGTLATEHPVEVEYPPGIRDGSAARISLARYGIENFFLTVLFRVSGGW
jgi:molecular chaperone DnaJ